MLSFKKYMNQIEEAAATIPAVGTVGATIKTQAPTTPINPATRTALVTAARSNPVALSLFSKGKIQDAIKKLTEDPIDKNIQEILYPNDNAKSEHFLSLIENIRIDRENKSNSLFNLIRIKINFLINSKDLFRGCVNKRS